MIRPSADIRDRYAEISEYCHQHNEPVFITKNGSGDLAVMSIDLYERLIGRQALYAAVAQGIADEDAERVVTSADALARARNGIPG